MIGSTGVLSQSLSTSVTLSALLEGAIHCYVLSQRLALMQPNLNIIEPPNMPRNDAGWTWSGSNPDLPPMVYLAGATRRTSSLIIMPECLDFLTGRSSSAMVNGHTSIYTLDADQTFERLLDDVVLLHWQITNH